MAINVRDGRWGLTSIVQEADGGFTTSAVLAGIAPIVENHYPPMNATKTGYVLPVALVRCVGAVNNTDPDTVLIPRAIDVSELTLGDLTAAQRTALRNALLTRLAAYDFTDWDGTLKQISAFTDASYTLATPLRRIARDIFTHLSHDDYRPKPLVFESHNTEYLWPGDTDPTSLFTAEMSSFAWDSGDSTMDVAVSADAMVRYSANSPGSIEHESQVTAVQHSTVNRLTMCGVRHDNTGVNDGYGLYEDGIGGAILARFNAGTRTVVTSTTTITATASQFRSYRLAASGTAGNNVVLDWWYVAHTTTKPSDPGWYGTDASPLQTYTDTSASRLDDAAHAQCGIGPGRAASGGTDWDTRHCFFKLRAISDRGGGGTVYTRTLSDAINANDAPSRGVRAFRQMPQDAVAVSDALSSMVSAAAGVITRLLQDNIRVEEAVWRTMRAYRLPMDNIAVADSLIRTGRLFRFATDGLNASDTLLATARAFRKPSDSIVVGDSVSRSAKLIRQLLDSVGITDSLISSITVAGVIIISRVLRDELLLDDAIRRGVKAYRLAHDDAAVNDALGRTEHMVRIVTDILTVAESTARSLILTRIAADNVAAADTAIRYALLNRLLHDDATAEDSLISNIGYFQLLIGFIMQRLVGEPTVMTLDEHATFMSMARAEPILMEMRNL